MMSPADIATLEAMRRSAPCTWRCCSEYYRIAAKYGIAFDNGESTGMLFSDLVRNDFIDQQLSRPANDSEKAAGSRAPEET